MKMSPFGHKLVRGIFRLLLIFIFIGIPAVALYLRQVGFTTSIRASVCALVRSQGIEMDMERLTFDPFQGLIAKDVKVRVKSSDAPLFVQINRVGLSLNIRALLHRKIEVDTASLHGAHLILPLDLTNPDAKLEFDKVNAVIIFLPDQIRIASLECKMGAIKLQVMGNVLNAQDFKMPTNTGPKSGHPLAQTIMDIRKLGAQFSFQKNTAQLEFQFAVDLAHLDTTKIDDIRFHAVDMLYGDAHINRFDIEADYNHGILNLERLEITDALGEFSVKGNLNPAQKQVSFEASSTIDIRPFFPENIRNGILKNIQFPKPPQAAFSGDLQWNEDFKITGQVFGRFVAPHISANGVELTDIDGEYTWKDGTFFTENFTVHLNKGAATADVYFAPNDFRVRLTSSIKPTDFMPWFDKGTRETIERMEFAEAPQLRVELSGKKPDIDALSGTGQLTLGKTAMRGAWITSAKSPLEIQGRAITLRNFEILMGTNKGTGTFTYDLGQKEVRIPDAKSQLPPYELLMWINPQVAEAVIPYRFKTPPTVTVKGVAGLEGAEKNLLNVTIDAPAGLTYNLLGKDLFFQGLKGRLFVKKDQLDLNISQSRLMGGQVKLQAKISVDPKNQTYGANVFIDGCDFSTLTKLYFDYNNSHGKVSGNYQFKTAFEDTHTMTGSGHMNVQDGNVFAIPLLGPLSDILNQIIPGSGYQNAKTATADFQVANGVITTRNLAIQSMAFSLYGHGKIFFLDDKMDMDIRINARGIPGIILFPVSKVFEYTSEGTLKNATWRPKLIPKAIFGSGNKTR
ncbi:MAG: AsmA-like C-terminal region-containing protein [Chthoniobacterales bacterium]